MDDVRNAARRLIKGRLRRHLVEALGSWRRGEAWPAMVQVEEGICEQAWSDWVMIRSGHADSDLTKAIQAAVPEAAEDVREAFAEVASSDWVDRQIRAFVDSFQVYELLAEG